MLGLAAGMWAGPAAAQPRPKGKIHYAFQTPYVYPNGPFAPGYATGRASVSAHYNLCRRDGRACTWSAFAFAQRVRCFEHPLIEPYPYWVWGSGPRTGNGAVRSGEQLFEMGTPQELELRWVCLYAMTQEPLGGDLYLETPYLLDAERIRPEP